MVKAIGEVRFEQRGRRVTARLTEDLHWRCNDTDVERFLNEACPIDVIQLEIHRPAVHGLYQAAERLGGEVVIATTVG